MAQIVKSEKGYWVGEELYKGEQYISFDDVRFFHPIEKIVTVDYIQFVTDIKEVLSVTLENNTPNKVIKMLSYELCNSEHGMMYVLDWKAPFGVRKVIDAPINTKNNDHAKHH